MSGAANTLPGLRQAIRRLAHEPAWALPVIALLAGTIAANTAVFSLVHAVLIRPLALPGAERIVRVYETYDHGAATGSVSLPNLEDWRREADAFESLGALSWGSRNLSLDGPPELVRMAEVTPELFSVFGARPMLGQLFGEAAARPGAQRVVVLTERLWRVRFASDRSIVGRTIHLDGLGFEVVGVVPSSIQVPTGGWQPALFLPHVPAPDARRSNHYLNVFGRLATGRRLAEARRQLESVAARLAVTEPEAQADRGVELVSATESVRGPVRADLWLLFGAVAVALSISVSNLGSLTLARVETRRREVAVRAALGASRTDLLRAVLTEIGLLSAVGLGVGLLLVGALLAWLTPRATRWLPLELVGPPTLDAPVLAFAFGIASVCGLAIGLFPISSTLADDWRRPVANLGDRSGGGAVRQRLRRGLVVAQLALSLSLLVLVGLLGRTLLELRDASPWRKGDETITFHITPTSGTHDPASISRRVLRPVLERLSALPGVVSAGVISHLPLQNWGWNSSYEIEGVAPPASGQSWWVEMRAASPGSLAALGLPLLAGREIADSDAPAAGAPVDAPYSAMVNRAFARRHFASPGDAVGRRLRFGPDDVVELVGVYESVRQSGLERGALPELTLLDLDPRNANLLSHEPVFVVRSDPGAMPPPESALREILHSVDPDQAVHTVRTLDDVVERSLSRRRFSLGLMGFFAAATALLAGTGLYGLLTFLVAQRRRELGVRMALGATTSRIARHILGESLALTAIGVLGGLAAGWAVARWIAGQLHGVATLDPATWLGAVASLVALSLIASWQPALRAARTEPTTALHEN